MGFQEGFGSEKSLAIQGIGIVWLVVIRSTSRSPPGLEMLGFLLTGTLLIVTNFVEHSLLFSLSID